MSRTPRSDHRTERNVRYGISVCLGGAPWFFFFQAEDGIRDHCVTGVQTCALPILLATVPLVTNGTVANTTNITAANGCVVSSIGNDVVNAASLATDAVNEIRNAITGGDRKSVV